MDRRTSRLIMSIALAVLVLGVVVYFLVAGR